MQAFADSASQDRNDGGTYGIHASRYENRNLVIRDSRIENMRYGIMTPRSDGSVAGHEQPTIIQNVILKNYINILVTPGSREWRRQRHVADRPQREVRTHADAGHRPAQGG